MKSFLIIIICLLFCLNADAQFYQSDLKGSQIDNSAYLSARRVPGILYVSDSLTTDIGKSEFKTINEALSNYSAGDLIMVYPSTYNENISIADSGVFISGIEPKNTIINGVVEITGKDNSIYNLTILDTFKLNCAYAYLPFMVNKISGVVFKGDIVLGDSATASPYNWTITNCSFDGRDKIFSINCDTSPTWGEHNIWFCTMFGYGDTSTTRPPTTYTIKMWKGSVRFQYLMDKFHISSIEYKTPKTGTRYDCILRFDNCSGVTVSDIVCSNSSVGWDVLALNSCRFSFWGNYSNKQIIIEGRFEFDMMWCQFGFAGDSSLVYNSTVASRWFSVNQVGWGSDGGLWGSGLINLHIFNSAFKKPTAPSGLGTDSNNKWNAFIDS